MRLRSLQRGSALMVTFIALAVLMVLVAGAIRFTGVNREAAASKMHSDKVGACADSARRYLLSRLTLFGVPVRSLKLQGTGADVLPDNSDATKRSQMFTSHYGETAASPTIVAVSAASVSASKDQIRDVANTLAGTTLGGQYYRVVVKCREPSSERESEVEFVFRYGI